MAGRLKRIAPAIMGIEAPLILDHCAVWFVNERTENKLLYDSARFELLGGPINDLIFMVDLSDPRQPDKWTLYTKRFGFHAPEFCCSHVRDMTEYINRMAQELEQGIIPPFLAEKAAAVEYILHRPVLYPSRALRREGEHSYSFLDRDDGRRKMVHVAYSLKDVPPEFTSGVRESGKREVLARGSEYIVVECCADRQALKAIRQRIQSQMNGLDDSAGKVRCRIRVLDHLLSRFRKAV